MPAVYSRLPLKATELRYHPSSCTTSNVKSPDKGRLSDDKLEVTFLAGTFFSNTKEFYFVNHPL